MKRQSPSSVTKVSELPPFFGQESLGERLIENLKRRQLATVILFAGPAHVGKLTGARWLAQTSLCQTPLKTGACGVCRDCRQVAQSTHPQIYQLEGGPADPLTVDHIRQLTQSLRLRRAMNEPSWVIMGAIEYLTEGAANACLKFFEEPPAGLYIVLTTSQPDRVPSTILSRAATYRWHLTPHQKYPTGSNTSRLFVQQLIERAAGRPEIWKKLQTNPEVFTEETEAVQQILEALDQTQPATWQAALDAIPDDRAAHHFDLWELVLRELLLVKLEIPSRHLWPQLHEKFVSKSKTWSTPTLLERLDRWQQRSSLLQQHVAPRLILADLLV